jgi:hypothetical protein
MSHHDGSGAAPASGPRHLRVGAVVLLASVVLLAGGFAFVAYAYPNIQIGPEQPIAFSHRLHANVKEIDCRFCHPFVERGKRAGLPSVGKCFYCHDTIITQHPEILKERAHLDAGDPVPWKRLMTLPDHVQFRHQPHLRMGFDCSECHGQVKAADRLPVVEFTMGFCITCHRENDANLDCWLACHN